MTPVEGRVDDSEGDGDRVALRLVPRVHGGGRLQEVRSVMF